MLFWSLKMSKSNFLEDFTIGQKIIHAIPRTISEGDASLYIGLTGDRRPLFCSHTFAARLGYKKVPVNDMLVFHIAFGRTVQDISLNAIANLGYAEVKFISPVFVGDTIRSESTVIGIKENSSKKNGIVYVHSIVYNQINDEVLSWKRWVMIPKKNHEALIPKTLVPKMLDYVDPKNISILSYTDARDFDVVSTGSNKLWDDYEVDDTIDHRHGLTVDDTAHTIATHLYQNNARLHFDAHLMKQSSFKKRLVYGGHIISLCHAINFQGMENTLNIVAINGGVHSNPSFSGDTIYAKTIVLEKNIIEGRSDLGLLRLRLVGIKNQEPSSLHSIMQEEAPKTYQENVVLDIDYTVTIPRGN
jgi:2-methylfumaryl-CoA hydratase